MTTNRTETALTETTANGQAALPVARTEQWNIDVAGPAFWSNLDTASELGQALVMKAKNAPDLRAEDVLNRPFLLQWALCHPTQLPDEKTGEVHDCIRTVLISPEGETLGFTSWGILNGLRDLVQLKGRGPWTPALQVFVKQVNTRRGFRTYQLSLPINLGNLKTEGKRAK